MDIVYFVLLCATYNLEAFGTLFLRSLLSHWDLTAQWFIRKGSAWDFNVDKYLLFPLNVLIQVKYFVVLYLPFYHLSI